MNTKLLASIAVFALFAGVISTSMMQSAYAADYGMGDNTADKKAADAKKAADKKVADAKKVADKKAADAKKAADKKVADAKKVADKKAADAKKTADKKAADAKKAADKKVADAKKVADKKAADAKKDSATGKATGKAASSDAVTIEMAKGAGSNTSCNDKCYTPSDVQLKVGGTVTWKNVDSAAHYATSGKDATPDGIFDSGMVMAGKTFKHTFDKAGTYDYYCMVHPWMIGKVTVS